MHVSFGLSCAPGPNTAPPPPIPARVPTLQTHRGSCSRPGGCRHSGSPSLFSGRHRGDPQVSVLWLNVNLFLGGVSRAACLPSLTPRRVPPHSPQEAEADRSAGEGRPAPSSSDTQLCSEGACVLGDEQERHFLYLPSDRSGQKHRDARQGCQR